jgi:hypothetical protein
LDRRVGVIALIYVVVTVVRSFFSRDGEVLPDFYQSWLAAYYPSPPHFWSLFQAYEREQLRGTIDDCF